MRIAHLAEDAGFAILGYNQGSACKFDSSEAFAVVTSSLTRPALPRLSHFVWTLEADSHMRLKCDRWVFFTVEDGAVESAEQSKLSNRAGVWLERLST